MISGITIPVPGANTTPGTVWLATHHVTTGGWDWFGNVLTCVLVILLSTLVLTFVVRLVSTERAAVCAMVFTCVVGIVGSGVWLAYGAATHHAVTHDEALPAHEAQPFEHDGTLGDSTTRVWPTRELALARAKEARAEGASATPVSWAAFSKAHRDAEMACLTTCDDPDNPLSLSERDGRVQMSKAMRDALYGALSTHYGLTPVDHSQEPAWGKPDVATLRSMLDSGTSTTYRQHDGTSLACVFSTETKAKNVAGEPTKVTIDDVTCENVAGKVITPKAL